MKKLVQKIKDTFSIFSSSKGFTLLELLVVVLIIGILAGIALPQYKKVVWKARFAEVYTITNALEKSIELYMLTHEDSMPKKEGDLLYLTPENLDIDVLSNFTEKEFNGYSYYCSKYVCYSVLCGVLGCTWLANIHTNTNGVLSFDNMISEMQGEKKSSGWYRSCWYEGETADIGKYLCESTNWDDINEGF